MNSIFLQKSGYAFTKVPEVIFYLTENINYFWFVLAAKTLYSKDVIRRSYPPIPGKEGPSLIKYCDYSLIIIMFNNDSIIIIITYGMFITILYDIHIEWL